MKDGFWDAAGRASVMGLHLVSGIIVGGLIGYGLDSWLETGPRGLLFFLLLGAAAGFRNMWQDAKKLMSFTAGSNLSGGDSAGAGLGTRPRRSKIGSPGVFSDEKERAVKTSNVTVPRRAWTPETNGDAADEPEKRN